MEELSSLCERDEDFVQHTFLSAREEKYRMKGSTHVSTKERWRYFPLRHSVHTKAEVDREAHHLVHATCHNHMQSSNWKGKR